MTNSVVIILVGIIIFLVGLIINITEGLESEIRWVGAGLLVGGIAIIVFFVIGKLKKWF